MSTTQEKIELLSGTQPIGNGLRFNQGKLRHDLLPLNAIKEISSILTKGAVKYAERNWERGMSWSSVISSLKRHLESFELGEDFDKETSCLHIAHVACNAMFLSEFYSIFPEGDDRVNSFRFKKLRKIGLDIDDVLADFVTAYCEKFDIALPKFWNFDRKFKERYEQLKSDKEFWLNLKPLVDPDKLPFEPACYITSRSIDKSWTEEWLDKLGFPCVPVYVSDMNNTKSDIAKRVGIDTFIDDCYENFVDLNSNGINCYLLTVEHNKRFDVGFKRINTIFDVPLLVNK